MQRILFHHGWANQRPSGHWMRITANSLRAQGHSVWYPQFPQPDKPVAADWQSLLVHEATQMDEVGALVNQSPKVIQNGSEKIAVAHSLGCINWLVAARAGKFVEPFDRLVFVAPPDPQLLEPVDGHLLDLADPEWLNAIQRNARSFTLIASDEDRWLPRGLEATYLQHWPKVDPVIVPGAQHFSQDDGWGEWTGLADWLAASAPSTTQLFKR